VNSSGTQSVKRLAGVIAPETAWGSGGEVSGLLRLDAGDYVEMSVAVDGGSSVVPLGTSTAYYPTAFSGVRVAP